MLRIELAFIAMVAVVVVSNVAVLFPINDWLTWGAFSYPVSFLITEMTAWFHGSKKARNVVYVGFAVGIMISIVLSTPRIAMASGCAFLFSQLLDITVFGRLRNISVWWVAPIGASMLASMVDSALFWSLAFYGEDVPFVTWAIGDTFVKFAVDMLMLLPFRMAFAKQIARKV